MWGAASQTRHALYPSVGRGALLCGARRLGAPSPCVGAASGRPGRTRPHLAGPESLRGVPARQGQGPFLFLRKKKRAFTPRRLKVRTTPFPPCGENSVPLPCASSPHKSCAFAGPPGPVYSRLVVENGGLRLYALFGDRPRPLRPSREGTGTGCGSIRPPPAGAALVTGVQLLIVQV